MVVSTLLDPLCHRRRGTSALDVSSPRRSRRPSSASANREFVEGTIVTTRDLSILYQVADPILVMYAGGSPRRRPRRRSHAPRHPYTSC